VLLGVGIWTSRRVMRTTPGPVGICGAAAVAALVIVSVAQTFDPHITLRGTSDILYPLLGLVMVGWNPISRRVVTAGRPVPTLVMTGGSGGAETTGAETEAEAEELIAAGPIADPADGLDIEAEIADLERRLELGPHERLEPEPAAEPPTEPSVPTDPLAQPPPGAGPVPDEVTLSDLGRRWRVASGDDGSGVADSDAADAEPLPGPDAPVWAAKTRELHVGPDLYVTTDDGEVYRFEAVDGAVRIGRSRDSDVRISDDFMSRSHLIVNWDGLDWVIEDRSKHRAFRPDGTRIDRAVVVTGHIVLRLGGRQGRLVAIGFEPWSEGEDG
ncbi:MAG: FHA domain-containing protein, partial [Actinomycetota bacterium]